jgi:putative transposase
MPRRKEPRIPDAVLDQLLAGADPKTAFDRRFQSSRQPTLGPLSDYAVTDKASTRRSRHC